MHEPEKNYYTDEPPTVKKKPITMKKPVAMTTKQ